MIFFYCNWVSTLWQQSIDLCKNRKDTAINKRRNSTQSSTQNTKYIKEKANLKKQENKHKEINKKHKSSNQKITKANNNQKEYSTEPTPPPLWRCGPTRTMASSFMRFLDHTQNDTSQSVGLLWTSDQLVAETSTWQHTTLTTDRHPCPCGIRTRDLSKQEAADIRVKPT